MIEVIHIRRCDLCGREMSRKHVQIKWPDSSETDVCHDCTGKLNSFLANIRNKDGVR
ncbi:MAG: hypothetical protein ACI381_06150 [Candidatus Methanomethylophilaceae archaeon]